MTEFPPTRTAALDRLATFAPFAGSDYARLRNFDLPGHPHVSQLSPYLRHRVITEEEVLRAVLQNHNAKDAEKFIQEVIWRTYWKGVLELRPGLWIQYKADLNADWNHLQTNGGLRADWEAACKGQTGIDCFDHWAQELVETGYLHNHARMWFASIWIFTLRLPWVLGADFFLRHLLDGDPASNTLSWRWVGGLQTKGKTYLARADNIAKYTNGQFRPTGLAGHAVPLDGPDLPPVGPAPTSDPKPAAGKTGLLITTEDLSPDFMEIAADATALFDPEPKPEPLMQAAAVTAFKSAVLADVGARIGGTASSVANIQAVTEWAQSEKLTTVAMAYAPTGPVSDHLNGLRAALTDVGINLSVQIRPYDTTAWPKATHGFFRFKDVGNQLTTGLT